MIGRVNLEKSENARHHKTDVTVKTWGPPRSQNRHKRIPSLRDMQKHDPNNNQPTHQPKQSIQPQKILPNNLII